MLNEILTVVILGIMIMVSVWAVKHTAGGIMHGIMVFVSIYLAYYILVNVIYVKKVPHVKLPSIFQEVDEGIEEQKKELNKYEFRNKDKTYEFRDIEE